MLLKKNKVNIKKAVNELKTVRDFVRFGVSKFNQHKIYFGHGTDNSWDEAVYLVLYALNLPRDIDTSVLDARLTSEEKKNVLDYIKKRIEKRVPAAYLTHEAWFAGKAYFVDERVLIPRSPIAELIEKEFAPWIEPEKVWRILDVGTGSAVLQLLVPMLFQMR